jgi:uncharacterized protein
MEFAGRYGPWALVVGGSTGLGAACATQAATRGLDVVLTARRAELLEDLAAELRTHTGVEVRTFAGDIGDPSTAGRLLETVNGLDVGLVVYNAAGERVGTFHESPLEDHIFNITANCTTPTVLSYELGRAMAARGRGGIALVSSMAALVGCSFMTMYSATKAFEWILGEGLYAEFAPLGVDVALYLLGSTATPTFIERYGAAIDPSRRGSIETDDPLETMFNRQSVPTSPAAAAEHLFENLGQGPVLYSDPIDERAAAKMRAMPRNELVNLMSSLVRGQS